MENKPLIGKISQVMGPVVDIRFQDTLPPLYSAIEINLNNQKLEMIRFVAFPWEQQMA